MTKRTGSGRNARWGLLASAVLMGIVLIGSTTSNYIGSRELSSTLARGHGELLLHGMRERMRQGAPSPAALNAAVSALSDQGLVYVAVVGKDDSIKAAGGTADGSMPLLGPAGGRPGMVIGRTIWMSAPMHRPEEEERDRPGRRGALNRDALRDGRLPPRRPGPPGDLDLPGGAGEDDLPDLLEDDNPPDDPDALGPLPRPRPLAGPARENRIVIQYRPILSDQLEIRATRALAAGLVAAAVLMLATIVFWRRSLQADAAEAGLEQQRRLASLGEMSAVLAHELRNPLTSLKGHAQLLVERLPEGSREREKADRVVNEAQRIERLCVDLLDFVKSGQIQRQPCSPSQMMREAIDAVEVGDIAVSIHKAPESWSLDQPRMHQVLTNLLQNARQASPGDAPIEAGVRVIGGKLELIIRDSGGGIPAGDEERIFEPFHTTRTRGVGLGLAVARRIVELHGGSITAANRSTGGAEFKILIPPA